MNYSTLNLLISEVLREPNYYTQTVSLPSNGGDLYPSYLDALQDSLTHDQDNNINWTPERAELLACITLEILRPK